MPCPRVFRPVALAAVLLVNASAAWSLGWARSQQAAVLGQPLSFVATLRLDPGDELDPACVQADVALGDQRLAPSQVRLSVDSSQRDALVMRVQSAVVVDEPVVAITLALGCPARMSRRFVLLADPPDLVQPLALPAAALAQADASGGAGTSARTTPAPGTPAGATAPAATGSALPTPSSAQATTASRAPATPPARSPAPVPVSSPAPAPAAAAVALAGTAAPPPATTGPAVPKSDTVPPERRADTKAANKPKPPPAAAPAAAASAPAPVRKAAGGARLQLDLSEPLAKLPPPSATATATAASAVAAALEAVAQAASAARSAASAASQAQDRLASMEKQVAALQLEAQQSRDLAAQMRSRLTSAEGASRWLMPLLLAVVALAGVAGWLAWKLRQLQAARQASWRAAAAADAAGADHARPGPATSQLPLVTSEIMAPSTVPGTASSAGLRPLSLDDMAASAAPANAWLPQTTGNPAPTVSAEANPLAGEGGARLGSGPADGAAKAYAPYPHLGGAGRTAAVAQPPLSPMERTLVLPPQAVPAPLPMAGAGADEGARDVSIEELLDLEQQAEFFIVLGQDDAAIDLLVDHLRNTGGGSPLPYLKLLEIYRRLGDHEAYERTRTRFNHRFNAYAPDWDTDLTHGRSLEDYAGVLPRLQQAWPRPLDAMAELEALLFRKSRGELFDLPAYREVLFLYALARDLLDRASAETGSVDLLLPLADTATDGPGHAHPYFGLERDSVFDTLREERPTLPVDLDLTQPDMPLSILDTLSPRRPG